MTEMVVVAEQAVRDRLATLRLEDGLEWLSYELAGMQELQDEVNHGGIRSPRTAVSAQFYGENALTARILLQLLISGGDAGDEPLGTQTMRDLSGLAHTLRIARILEDRLQAGLCKVSSVALKRSGEVDFKPVDLPPFHLSRYEQAMLTRIASPGRDEPDAHLVEGLVGAWETGAALPEEWKEIDGALRASQGHGLVARFAALAFLAKWNSIDDVLVNGRRSSERDLVDAAIADVAVSAPHVDSDELVAALRALIWRRELLLEQPIDFEQYRETPARMYSRPILELPGGDVYVVRRSANAAIAVLVQRLLEGNWPEELSGGDRDLEKALEKRRSRLRPIEGFERDVARALQETTLPFLSSIPVSKGGQVSSLGVTTRSEIDAVVAVPQEHRIWVIEAKDLAQPLGARRIRSELDKYFRERGHQQKLLEKCEDVRSDPSAAAAALGFRGETDWEVSGMFVTREPSPAVHDDRSRFPFVLIEELSGFLVP